MCPASKPSSCNAKARNSNNFPRRKADPGLKTVPSTGCRLVQAAVGSRLAAPVESEVDGLSVP
jgi:hypothetical protein